MILLPPLYALTGGALKSPRVKSVLPRFAIRHSCTGGTPIVLQSRFAGTKMEFDTLHRLVALAATGSQNLPRLHQRGLGPKRALALREFALGHEALHRFVEREPLYSVHECVFGVLALESEPVDPRL